MVEHRKSSNSHFLRQAKNALSSSVQAVPKSKNKFNDVQYFVKQTTSDQTLDDCRSGNRQIKIQFFKNTVGNSYKNPLAGLYFLTVIPFFEHRGSSSK